MGSTKNVVVSTTSATSTTAAVNLATFSLPSAGTWLINCTCGAGGGSTATIISISTASASFQNNSAQRLDPGWYCNLSYPITVQSATTMYIVAALAGSVVTISPIWVFITRIG